MPPPKSKPPIFTACPSAKGKASPAAWAAWADGTPPNWKQPASAAPPKQATRKGSSCSPRITATATEAHHRIPRRPLPYTANPPRRDTAWPRLPLPNGMRSAETFPKTRNWHGTTPPLPENTCPKIPARKYLPENTYPKIPARKYLPDNPEADRLFRTLAETDGAA